MDNQRSYLIPGDDMCTVKYNYLTLGLLSLLSVGVNLIIHLIGLLGSALTCNYYAFCLCALRVINTPLLGFSQLIRLYLSPVSVPFAWLSIKASRCWDSRGADSEVKCLEAIIEASTNYHDSRIANDWGKSRMPFLTDRSDLKKLISSEMLSLEFYMIAIFAFISSVVSSGFMISAFLLSDWEDDNGEVTDTLLSAAAAAIALGDLLEGITSVVGQKKSGDLDKRAILRIVTPASTIVVSSLSALGVISLPSAVQLAISAGLHTGLHSDAVRAPGEWKNPRRVVAVTMSVGADIVVAFYGVRIQMLFTGLSDHFTALSDAREWYFAESVNSRVGYVHKLAAAHVIGQNLVIIFATSPTAIAAVIVRGRLGLALALVSLVTHLLSAWYQNREDSRMWDQDLWVPSLYSRSLSQKEIDEAIEAVNASSDVVLDGEAV